MKYSEDQIENLLRRAPRPRPSPALRGQIVQGVPQSRTDAPGLVALSPQPWWLRWWPAVAAGGLACVSLAVLAVQQAQISALRQEIQILKQDPALLQDGNTRAGTSGSSQDSPPAVEVPQADAQAELERLRATVRELSAEIAALEAMRTENEQLRTAAAANTGLTPEELEGLTKAREKALRIQCVNNLKQLGLAARIWSADNGDVLPPDILSMANYIASPKVLVCPADQGRQPAPDWASFSSANVSYQFLAPSGSDTEPQRVMFQCAIHNNVTLCDGSVQQLDPARNAELLIQRDGKLYLGNPPPSTGAGMSPGIMTKPPVMDVRMMERYGLLPQGFRPDTNEPPPEPEP